MVNSNGFFFSVYFKLNSFVLLQLTICFLKLSRPVLRVFLGIIIKKWGVFLGIGGLSYTLIIAICSAVFTNENHC